jgi:hypothetical protein
MVPWTVLAFAVVSFAPTIYMVVMGLGATWIDAVVAALYVLLLVGMFRRVKMSWWALLNRRLRVRDGPHCLAAGRWKPKRRDTLSDIVDSRAGYRFDQRMDWRLSFGNVVLDHCAG